MKLPVTIHNVQALHTARAGNNVFCNYFKQQLSCWNGQPLDHNRHGPKSGGAAVPLSMGGAGIHLTMSPAPRPTSIPSGILIRPTDWPQYTNVLWHCWLGIRKSIRPVKNEWCIGMVTVCLKLGANDLHMVQVMPLPPQYIVSCFIKIQIPFCCRLIQVVLERGR